MSVNTAANFCIRSKFLLRPRQFTVLNVRNLVSKKSGALLPKPRTVSFGLIRVAVAVVPGLFIGAGISKTMANFLEENDLFVPSDDDDEDD
ncbi:UNVERIFIED_CONTAM: hypothetical protein PYX00_005269 [Menopon gallinae]|uniref:Essential MCU regulator, mitochondrial n=1 Tax=Menopon gallinae TaxID=328185 RepID=A0AAW2HQZ9_9NEOP